MLHKLENDENGVSVELRVVFCLEKKHKLEWRCWWCGFYYKRKIGF